MYHHPRPSMIRACYISLRYPSNLHSYLTMRRARNTTLAMDSAFQISTAVTWHRHASTTSACKLSPHRALKQTVRAALAIPRETQISAGDIRFAENDGVGGNDTGLPLDYDEEAIREYWSARPGAARARLIEVLAAFTPLVTKVSIDLARGTLSDNSAARAAELRDVLTRLGPTFVKLGQALSVRPDIIGPSAMNELRLLCDAVPSFSNDVAFAMIEEELGRPVTEMYTDMSESPIAAASLGQVYKAKLRENGQEVAIKVQRPDMLRKVSLDLYCLKFVARLAGTVQEKFTSNKTDYLSLLAEWAKGTYKELDYENEAANSRRFARLVQARIPDVVVPAVFDEFTSRKVLTMEWINGTKLADCDPDQINELVGKGVECFLFQLLSAGYFHSDPHTGNLMRLPDGRLCVIDFGLMAEIEKEEMDAMVSAIVHLANRDWPRVVEDFIALKFLPSNVDTSQVERVLGAILSQALEGGGANSINFQSLSDELASVTFDFPFRIPPSFALLLRALSVLEGIALVGDPKFKLIMESFPFVSRLVITDKSPQLKEALRQILYKDGAFSVTRLRVLVDSAQGMINDGDAFVDFDTVSRESSVTPEALSLLLGERGGIVRDILAEEIARGIDVLARDSYARLADNLRVAIPTPVRAVLGAMANAGPPLPTLLQPGAPFFALPPVNEEERRYLDNMRELIEWMIEGSNGKANEQVMQLLPDVIRKSGGISREIAARLGETYVERFFRDVVRGGGVGIAERRKGLANFDETSRW